MPTCKDGGRKKTLKGTLTTSKQSGRKTAVRVHLTPEERRTLMSWQRSISIPAGLAKRSRLILLVASGEALSHVALTVGISRRFVYKWVDRFLAKRLDGLPDKKGRGRKASLKP